MVSVFEEKGATEALTLSVFDGGQLLVHGLVSGFGKGFSGGTVAVVHQVGSHHPDEDRKGKCKTQSAVMNTGWRD